MNSLALQLYTFLVVVLTGIAASLLFDVYRAWRRIVRPRGLGGDVADLVCGVLLAMLVAGGVFLSNWGELRLYVLLGLVAGAVLYHGLAAAVVRPAARWGLLASARFLRRGWRVLTWPVRLAFALGRRLGHGAAGAARAVGGRARVWLRWCRRRIPFIHGLL